MGVLEDSFKFLASLENKSASGLPSGFVQGSLPDRKTNVFVMVENTRVYWDDDFDMRAIHVMDSLVFFLKNYVGYNPIIAAGEHNGTLHLLLEDVYNKEPFLDWLRDFVSDLIKALNGDRWSCEFHFCDFPFNSFRDNFYSSVEDSISRLFS